MSASATGARAVRGRYAPSPTGLLHVGNARTALLAWLAARALGGAFVMRVEDLDRARVVPGAEAELLDDLRWLGLDWDEGPDKEGDAGPYRQSERTTLYDGAIERLLTTGRAFLCACSRAEIARAASAPHDEDEEGPRYPGTCRGLAAADVVAQAGQHGRAPVVRFAGHSERITFVDQIHGEIDPLQGAGIDDFVLRRADGVAAYQLAVVVDDAAMAITEVVRGDDLLRSTPRQIALARALGLASPSFAHVPLLLRAGRERMAKRTRPPSLRELRSEGVDARDVVGRLAASAGLCGLTERLPAGELLARMHGTPPWTRLERGPVVWDDLAP